MSLPIETRVSLPKATDLYNLSDEALIELLTIRLLNGNQEIKFDGKVEGNGASPPVYYEGNLYVHCILPQTVVQHFQDKGYVVQVSQQPSSTDRGAMTISTPTV